MNTRPVIGERSSVSLPFTSTDRNPLTGNMCSCGMMYLPGRYPECVRWCTADGRQGGRAS